MFSVFKINILGLLNLDESSFPVGKSEQLTIEKELQNQTIGASDELILECRIRGVTDGFTWLYNHGIITEALITRGRIELESVSRL